MRKLELELCEKFGLCWGLKQPPHITIKAPFKTENSEPFIHYLENLAQKTSPFEIELDGFNYFEPKIIFLDVKENSELKELHFKILKDLKKEFNIEPHEFEGENVKFHSTITTEDCTEEKFKEAKHYLKKYHPELKFSANSIGIFHYLGKEAGWIVTHIVKLKK